MARQIRPRVVMMASDWIPGSPEMRCDPHEPVDVTSPLLEQKGEMERILPPWVPGSPNTQAAAMERELALKVQTMPVVKAVHLDSIVHDHPLR